MMKTPSLIPALLTCAGLLVPASGLHAAISQVADYALGETGSVGASSPYTALVDSITSDPDGANNIPNWNAPNGTANLVTSGLAAPGSTTALEMSNNAGGGGTWYGSSFNGGSGYSTDWGFDLWLRPDASGGTFLGATDGNGAAQTGLVFWATNTSYSGTSLGGNTIASGSTYLVMSNGSGQLAASTSTYTIGTWVNVSIINHGGTVHYYLNGILQDSAVTSGVINDIRLGAGYWAATGSNGAFDEMKVWTFDSSSDSLASVETAMGIPEPAAVALLGLGALTLMFRRRKIQKASRLK